MLNDVQKLFNNQNNCDIFFLLSQFCEQLFPGQSRPHPYLSILDSVFDTGKGISMWIIDY